MPREFNRSDRVSKQMQRELAEILRQDLKDPRLGMITLQEVRASRDLSFAKVYFTLMGEADLKEQLRLLKDSTPFLRREIGRRMRLRILPQLEFLYDSSIEEGAELASLIARAVLQNTKDAN
jgi:ribosome-binding factor A